MTCTTKHLTLPELQAATQIIRRARTDFAAEPSVSIDVTNLRDTTLEAALVRLAKIGEQHNDIRQVDLRSSRQSTTKALHDIFEAAVELKAQGALGPLADGAGVPAELAGRVVAGEVPSRADLKQIRRVAGLDLARLFDNPVGERAVRIHAENYLYRTLGVPAEVIKASETQPRLPLREVHERKTNASLALLTDPRLPEAFAKALIEGLVITADEKALPTLKALATKLPESLRPVLAPAMREIERRTHLTLVCVSMEVRPYCGAGGLGAVMGDLPEAWARLGHRVIVVAPRHEVIAAERLETAAASGRKGGVVYGSDGPQPYKLIRGKEGADKENPVEHWFIENDAFFSKNRKTIYSGQDAAERYDFFSAGLPGVLRNILGDANPDAVLLNDAHTALGAAYLKLDPTFEGTKVITVLHNVGEAYQGRFSADLLQKLRVDRKLFQVGGEPGDRAKGALEFYGDVNFLKCGAVLSDACVTVSHQYMLDLLTPEKGHGMHGIFSWLHREGRLFGHPNGIDGSKWNPKTDPLIPARFSYGDSGGKAKCKRELQKLFNLPPRENTPVMGVVARLAEQKGFDDLVPAMERAMEDDEDIQFVIVGDGDPKIAAAISELARMYPDRVAMPKVFSEALEHKVVAGSDFFLMPSHFEPCGLPQMFTPQYLTVPLVRATGGLEETVIDHDPKTGEGHGFKFTDDLPGALKRATDWYRSGDAERGQLLRNGASTNFEWSNTSALDHLAMIRTVLSF